MRKALISIALATTMVATIIGCGNKATTSEVVPNETTMETTLVVEATTESTTKATTKVEPTKETTTLNVETTTKANVETKKVEETTTKATTKTTTPTTSNVETTKATPKATPKVEETQTQVIVEETTPYVEPITEPQVEETTPYVEPTQAQVVENTTQAPTTQEETTRDPRLGEDIGEWTVVDPAEANKVTDIVINNGTDVWVPEETFPYEEQSVYHQSNVNEMPSDWSDPGPVTFVAEDGKIIIIK